MELVLKIDGQDKAFVAPFISGRMFRRTLEIRKKTDFGAVDETTLDKLVDYVVETYGNQFTRDQYYDGIPAQKVLTTILDCMSEVMDETTDAAGGTNDPNA